MRSPDFVKLAEAHGLTGIRDTQRAQVEEAVRKAQRTEGTVIVEFKVEQEDSVYPMVPTGADLHAMIRRPMSPSSGAAHNPIFETGKDD
jgi:acetolactate synthase-1/2/3 large subunit